MKKLKAFFIELLPLLASIAAWLYDWRPVTRLISAIDPHLTQPLGVSEATKVGWDISFLLALLAGARMAVRRPRLLSLQGTVVNGRTMSKRTTLSPSDDEISQPETLRLLVKAHLVQAWFLRCLEWLGGVSLVIRRPSKTISIALDARHAGDRNYFTRSRRTWPAIRLSDQFDDRPVQLDLDYMIAVQANGVTTQTGTIRVEVWPQTEERLRCWAATALIWLFVVTEIDEHTVHIQPKTRR